MRFGVYDTPAGRRVRAFQGQSLAGAIAPLPNTMPMSRNFLIHAATLGATHRILYGGARSATDSIDPHLSDDTVTSRHHLYLGPKSRPAQIWLVIDVLKARARGYNFRKLANELVVSRGAKVLRAAVFLYLIGMPAYAWTWLRWLILYRKWRRSFHNLTLFARLIPVEIQPRRNWFLWILDPVFLRIAESRPQKSSGSIAIADVKPARWRRTRMTSVLCHY